MKEYIIKIPDDSEEIVTAVMEKFGVKTIEIKPKKRIVKKTTSKKKKPSSKKKIDHTYLFDKWKNVEIDAETLREQSW
ncbi:MAG: hypothetical protein ABI691_07285 [Ginsengibacter sp.]